MFVCHNPSGQISAAFLFEPLLGLREAFGDAASFWLAGLGLGELPWGLLGAASLSEASLAIVGAMTANCPGALSLLSDPAAETTKLSHLSVLCALHWLECYSKVSVSDSCNMNSMQDAFHDQYCTKQKQIQPSVS